MDTEELKLNEIKDHGDILSFLVVLCSTACLLPPGAFFGLTTCWW